MIDLSRRSFLIGSAAALAVVTLPSVPSVPQPQLLVSPSPYRLRVIYDIMVTNLSDKINVFEMSRDNAMWPFFKTATGPYGLCRWCACPGQEIWLPDRATFNVQSSQPNEVGEITLVCKDRFDGDHPDEGIRLFETHRFGKQPSSDIGVMDLENYERFEWIKKAHARKVRAKEIRAYKHQTGTSCLA